jgi:hypothetical protein
MTNRIRRIGVCSVLLISVALVAQTKGADLVADIPFAFIVAGRALPAGRYVVNRLNDDIRMRDGQNQTVFVPAHSAERQARDHSSKIVFHRYGNTYFLEEVWVGSASIGRAVFPSAEERELKERGVENEIAAVRLGR